MAWTASVSAMRRCTMRRLCVGFAREEKKLVNPSERVVVVNVRP